MGLLSLPRKIREQIYEDVLSTSLHRPPSPDQAGPRLEEWYHEVASPCPRFLHQPNLRPPAACQGLFESNRQIRSEVEQTLSSSNHLTYELDIMIEHKNGEGGHRVWPTWTVFPAPIKYIRSLNVKLRVFKQCVYITWRQTHECICSPLFISLSRLFHHGPQFIYKGPFKPRLHIDNLTVHLWSETYPFTADKLNFTRTFNAISTAAGRGIFTGKISRIRVCKGETIKEVQAKLLEKKEVPEYAGAYCRKIGFTWGVEPPSEVETDVL